MKKVYLLIIGIILFLPYQTVASSSNNALILLSSIDINSMHDAIRYVEGKGCRMVHVYPPHVMIGYVPVRLDEELIGKYGIIAIYRTVIDISDIKKYGNIAVYGCEAWNNNFMDLAKEHGLVPHPDAPEPPPIPNDMLTPPKPIEILLPKRILKAPPYGASSYDVSEYMIGDIAVGIILPESDGGTDTETEDWTQTEVSNVISEIQAGMDWWANREPDAYLTFFYDIQGTISTGYEPITRPHNDHKLWIDDVMTKLGYTSGSYWYKVYSYNNDIRDTLTTHWAVSVFVVDSSEDEDGKFSNGQFAYAYIGGPFTVMTYDNNGYGIANMDAVTAHELGHIFYACDEYSGSCYGTHSSGYLNVQNDNAVDGGTTDYDCIMRSQVAPFTNEAVCPSTRGQLGWRDTDADDILDIVDTMSITLNEYLPDPTTTNTPTYTGSTTLLPLYPNNNPYIHNPSHIPRTITVSAIANVQYRINTGSWTNTTAEDGNFDSVCEGYLFTTLPLPNGTYLFEVRGINSIGNVEHTPYGSDTLTIFKLGSPTITISPTYGTVGSFVTVIGSGFFATELIIIDFGTTDTIATTTTDAFGLFSTTFIVDMQPYGTITVSATGKISNAKAITKFIITTKEWTFMVYLDGDNDLEDAAIDDFLEMAQVGSNNDINIVVQMDRIDGYDNSYDDWNICHRFLVTYNMSPYEENAISDWGDGYGGREVNMADPKVLLDFINWATTNYPAKKYALILWNHGSGWRIPEVDRPKKAVCWDDTSAGDCLYMAEVRQAIGSATTYLNLIGFDVCFGGMVEVAYALRGLCDVMVASEEFEPGDGWPYDTILPDLTGTPTMSAKELGHIIVSRYGEYYTSTSPTTTQSAIDMNKLDNLIIAIDNFADSMNWYATHTDWQKVKEARDSIFAYGEPDYHGIDIYFFADKVQSKVSDLAVKSAANDLKGTITSIVIANYRGSLRDDDDGYGSYGLALYFPQDITAYNNDSESYAYEEGNTYYPVDYVDDHNWDNFIHRFYDVTGTVALPSLIFTKKVIYTGTISTGATLTYTLYYENVGAGTATNVILTDVIPAGTTYITDSAAGANTVISYSHDGGITFDSSQSPPVTHIRWELTIDIVPGESGNVSFKVRIE